MSALDRPDPGQALPFASTRSTPSSVPRLTLRTDEDGRAVWCRIAGGARRTLTPGLLEEVSQAYAAMRAGSAPGEVPQFLVLDGDPNGAFSLGLDLQGLAGLIRLGDRNTLRAYLSAYAGVLHGTAEALGLPLVTLALLRGDALGAGLELALACDLVVAERGSRFGFAEALLGLPDTGASLLVGRRLGPERAQDIVRSGRVYGAEELHELGLVDVLAEPGQGEAVVRETLAKVARRYNAQQAVYQVKRRVSPIARDDVQDLVEGWVEAALALGPAGRRTFERLALVQGSPDPSSAATDLGQVSPPVGWSVFG